MEKVFDNEHRNRYYGLRKGDIVEYGYSIDNPPILKGEVVEYGVMDNNAVYIDTGDGKKPKRVVAEWCKIITHVEDKINKNSNN